MYVLREEISVGYWNKPNYLISLVLRELAKPAEQRIEWLMWVDADSIILNPAIPPDIFLPPPDIDDIHFIASKDHNGLNTGIIFLRIHRWTANMLIETLGNPLFHPEIDLGWSADQTSMAHVLAKEDGGPDGTGYKRHAIYLPRAWFNAYQHSDGFDGSKGDLLVHSQAYLAKDGGIWHDGLIL
ncbi:hypothetical protein K4F52_003981 [Lecanicillium sp. MT-2017a]|nr:hypothetical protein K4F52_003981 [Lecanicillium sp. MT-2017a]